MYGVAGVKSGFSFPCKLLSLQRNNDVRNTLSFVGFTIMSVTVILSVLRLISPLERQQKLSPEVRGASR
jgi:hypothetical protein